MYKSLYYKILIAFLLLVVLPQTIKASKYNDMFYPLYINGEMSEWVKVLDSAKTEYKIKPESILLEDIIRAQYGLCAFYLGNNEDEKALNEIESATNYLNKLEQYYPNEGWVYALKASFQSFKLIISPLRFFFKGPQILSAINKSHELSPNHIDVMFLKANQTFYMPSIIGGDQQKGLEYFRTLELKLVAQPIKHDNDWFSLLYLTSNAIACNATHNYNEAIRIYTLILDIEPNYLWVKNELLPQSIKKQENEYLKRRKEKVDKKIQ